MAIGVREGSGNTMKLITVDCVRSPEHEDTESRFAVVVATTGKVAEALCEAAYRKDGYTRFDALDLIEGQFAGPARVIGYAGHTPNFSWAKSSGAGGSGT